jgi:hypothetical protein
MWASLIAWLLPAAKHAVWRFVSVLCVGLVVGLLVYGGYRIINPKPTTSQKGEIINNYNYNCKALIGWGCGKAK